MGNLLSLDNVFFRGMGKIFDVVVLSIIFILSCLPIITIGPAITALYYSTVKSIRHDRSYPIKEFFRAFKRDFRQSFIVMLLTTILCLIVYADIKIIMYYSNLGFESLKFVYIIVALFVLFISMYAYPLISRFSLRLLNLFKLSFYLVIKHFIVTIFSTILLLIGAILIYLSNGLVLLFLPVVLTLLISIMMEKVLNSCLSFVEDDSDNENKDRWYLE